MKKKKQHPPVSTAGSHLDEEIERIALLAHRYYEEEGRPEGRAVEHWIRAERELRGPSADHSAETPRAIADTVTEEEMLDQADRKRA